MSSTDDFESDTVYLIRLAPRALTDAEEVYDYIARDNPVAAEHWRKGLVRAIDSLSRFPQRCTAAPEDRGLRIGLRHHIFGVYRILFTVDVEQALVSVPHIRHGARSAATLEELG